MGLQRFDLHAGAIKLSKPAKFSREASQDLFLWLCFDLIGNTLLSLNQTLKNVCSFHFEVDQPKNLNCDGKMLHGSRDDILLLSLLELCSDNRSTFEFMQKIQYKNFNLVKCLGAT